MHENPHIVIDPEGTSPLYIDKNVCKMSPGTGRSTSFSAGKRTEPGNLLSKIVGILRYEGEKEVKVRTPHASAVGLGQYIMNNN